ncbi:MAG TPA: NAD(P)-dependent oxidoreductase, partial [Magnetospirillaceae bacterium]
MSKTVGMVGLGIMGSAISRNLAERGWRVIGFDTDAGRRAEAAKAGVVIAEDTAGIARDAPVIMTSLPSPAAVIEVAGIIAGSAPSPRIVVELSTLTIADKLRFEAILKQAGHNALDCPLSGTGAQAKTGDIVIYASGGSAEVKKLRPMFAGFSRGVYDLGEFGNGSRMKYVANLLVAIHNVASAEAMVLGMKSGLPPQLIFDLIQTGAGN